MDQDASGNEELPAPDSPSVSTEEDNVKDVDEGSQNVANHTDVSVPPIPETIDSEPIVRQAEPAPPLNYDPSASLYSINVSQAVKNGEFLVFTIQVHQADNPSSFLTMERQYEDLQYLDQCLIANNDITGLILPPLPFLPDADAKSAEARSRRQLGSSNKMIVGDDFTMHCMHTEKYLKMLISHPVFGRDKALQAFFEQEEAPFRTRVKKGLMGWLSSVIDEARKGQHKDVDERFQSLRVWSSSYNTAIKSASQSFNSVMSCQLRLASTYNQLALSIGQMEVYQDSSSLRINRVFAKLGESLEDTKNALESQSNSDEKTFGFDLGFYATYIDAARDMLFRRICVLVNYQDAKRTLEHAKPAKQQHAQEQTDIAQKAYDECTANAKQEMKQFHKERLYAFQDSLVAWSEMQLKTSRDVYAQLVRTLNQIKTIET